MATTTTPDTSPPEAPEQTPPPRPSGRRTIVLGTAAVLAAYAAVAALAVATLLGTDSRDGPVGRPALDQPRNTPTDDGPVENSAGSAPACWWTSEANEPVFPNNDIGGPPTPQSVLIFESCDGQLTGTIAWLNPGPDPAPDQGPGALPEAGGGDSGLVNPWAAGDAAVDRYLSELGPQCAPAEPGPPATC